jgi:hypothetical protein
MENYRKKPVVIQAVQLSKTNWREIEALAPDKIHFLGNRTGPDKQDLDCVGLNILTLEGALFCEIGDWVIRGLRGEYYSCKPDIFEKSYEHVEEV